MQDTNEYTFFGVTFSLDSLFRRLFGQATYDGPTSSQISNSQSSAISTSSNENKIAKYKENLTVLDAKIEHINTQIQSKILQIKQNIKTNKPYALELTKQKLKLDKELNFTTNARKDLNTQIEALDSIKFNKYLFDIKKNIKEDTEKEMNNINIDDIDDLNADIELQMETNETITQVVCQKITTHNSISDIELENELENILNEEEKEKEDQVVNNTLLHTSNDDDDDMLILQRQMQLPSVPNSNITSNTLTPITN